MGCSSSKANSPKVQAKAAPAVQATLLTTEAPAGFAMSGKGQPGQQQFQIKLAGEWKNYEKQEGAILKKAYLVGQPNCKFHFRGQSYEYSFTKMKQKNLGTHKEREIRPPRGFKAPKVALLPKGPMTVLTVRPGQPGTTIELPDPNNKGKTIQVNVPSGAKPGQKMAVPLPEPGESIQEVQAKQRRHSTGAKLAMGTAGIAAVGGLAVGGVILGDHLTGGTLGVSEAAADVVEAVGDWAEGGVEEAPGAAEAAVDWAEGAGADAGDWIETAAEDAGDWLGDAAEDTGDFIMSLF